MHPLRVSREDRHVGLLQEPSELDEQIEIAAGRRAPYSQLGDWVALSGISDRAKALYWHLAMHINQQRGDFEVWPSKELLAGWMGLKKADSVDPYLNELVRLGAVEKFQRRSYDGMRSRNRYVIHQEPPQDYTGVRSLKEFYELRRVVSEAVDNGDTAGHAVPRSTGVRSAPNETPGQPVPRSTGVPIPAAAGAAIPAAAGSNKTKVNKTKKPSPLPPQREVIPVGAGAQSAEAEEIHLDEHEQSAAQLLASLPVPWRLGRSSAQQFQPVVAELLRGVDGTAWPMEALRSELCRDLPAVIRSSRGLLRARLNDLPPPPAAPLVRPQCGECDGRGLLTDPATELPMPCPRCKADELAALRARKAAHKRDAAPRPPRADWNLYRPEPSTRSAKNRAASGATP